MSVTDHLAQLESAQLVRRLSDPELAYMFKSILVQETAYNSVLMKRRRELHGQVARAIETLHADRLEELAPLLAHHYAEAGDDPSATLRYARMAGDAASRRYANTEAIQHYGIALKAAHAIPAVESETLLHLYTSRGRAHELSGGYEQALANYAELSALADRRGDRRLELAALMAVATIRSTPNAAFDAKQAQALCDQALALAQELGDRRPRPRSCGSCFCSTTSRRTRRNRSRMASGRSRWRASSAYASNSLLRSMISIAATRLWAESRMRWRPSRKPKACGVTWTTSRCWPTTSTAAQRCA